MTNGFILGTAEINTNYAHVVFVYEEDGHEKFTTDISYAKFFDSKIAALNFLQDHILDQDYFMFIPANQKTIVEVKRF